MNMRLLNAGAVLLAATLLTACFERPPVDTVQRGYRGTGMEVVANPRTIERQIPNNQPPADPGPALPDAGPRARDIYKNVQVLGDLSVANFNRHMAQITSWVAPQQGCNYCHVGENFADDSLYTKVVARRMIQMNQHLNVNWKQHVGATGVTCYTCHRGNPVPANIWFTAQKQNNKSNFIGAKNQQNTPLPVVAMSSLPNDPFSAYLQGEKAIRVNSPTALPTGNRSSIQQAEHTFGLMVHFSKALGVNCTYCHNTRQTGGDWPQGVMPTNATAYHGIRMVRSANNEFLQGLTNSFPEQRRGPTGDVAKVNCATCHQGAFKPLYGAQMAKDFPELLQVTTTTGAAAATGTGLAANTGMATATGFGTGMATATGLGTGTGTATGIATPTATATATAPATAIAASGAALPPPVDSDQRAVLYFGVGSSALDASQATGVAKLMSYLAANPTRTALISGYHSASGDLATNQELAKQRAMAVRSTLQAAGVAANRVVLDKPLQTEANILGEDPQARRVEVTIR